MENWIYLDGRVERGPLPHFNLLHTVGSQLAGEPSLTQVANLWSAGKSMPQGLEHDIARGVIDGNQRPIIWESNVDRNHVWDAVSDHLQHRAAMTPVQSKEEMYASIQGLGWSVKGVNKAQDRFSVVLESPDGEVITRPSASTEEAAYASALSYVWRSHGIRSGFHIEAAATGNQVRNYVENNLLPKGGKFDQQYPEIRSILLEVLNAYTASGDEPDPRLWAVEQLVNLAKKNVADSWGLWQQTFADPVDKFGQVFGQALRDAAEITPLLQRYNLPKNIEGTSLQNFSFRIQTIQEEYQDQERTRQFKEKLRSGEVKWDAEPLPVELSEGYKVWPVQTANDLGLEGSVMNHCLGDPNRKHFPRIREGLTNAYSLRDKDGIPHGTMELTGDDNLVLSAHGWNDHALSPKYEGLLDQFFAKPGGEEGGHDTHDWFQRGPGQRSGIRRAGPAQAPEPTPAPTDDDWMAAPTPSRSPLRSPRERERPYVRWSSFQVEAATSTQVIQHVEKNLLPEGGKFDLQYPGIRKELLRSLEETFPAGDEPNPQLWAVEQLVNLAKKNVMSVWDQWINYYADPVGVLGTVFRTALQSAADLTPLMQRYNLPKKVEAETLGEFTRRAQDIQEEYVERERLREFKEKLRSGEVKWDAQPIPVELPEGYKVWPIETANDLQLEGEVMTHCIGHANYRHFPRIRAGDTHAFSLRDKDGVPHATLELSPDDKLILSAHGWKDHALNSKYEGLLDQFFEKWAIEGESHDWFSHAPGTRSGERRNAPPPPPRPPEPRREVWEGYWQNNGLAAPEIDGPWDLDELQVWLDRLAVNHHSLESYFEDQEQEEEDDEGIYIMVIPPGPSPVVIDADYLFKSEDAALRSHAVGSSPPQQDLWGEGPVSDWADKEIDRYARGLELLDDVCEARDGYNPYSYVSQATEYFNESNEEAPNPHIQVLIQRLDGGPTQGSAQRHRRVIEDEQWGHDWDWTPAPSEDWMEDDWVGRASSFQVEAATPNQVIEHVDKNLIPEGGKFDTQYPNVRLAILENLRDLFRDGEATDPRLWAVEQLVNLAKKQAAANWENWGKWTKTPGEEIYWKFYDAVYASMEVTPLLQRYNLPKKVDDATLEDFRDRMTAIIAEYAERERIRVFKEKLRSGEVKWDAEPLPVALPEGYKVWPIQSEHDLKIEGEIMHHCIGRPDHKHFPRIREGLTNAFSLRDKDGVPHGTLELSPDNKLILSAHGWSDHPLNAKYEGLLDQFFETLDPDAQEGEPHDWFSKSQGDRSGERRGRPPQPPTEVRPINRPYYWLDVGLRVPNLYDREDFAAYDHWDRRIRNGAGVRSYLEGWAEQPYENEHGERIQNLIPPGPMPDLNLDNLLTSEDDFLRHTNVAASPKQHELFGVQAYPGIWQGQLDTGTDVANREIIQFVRGMTSLDTLLSTAHTLGRSDREEVIDTALDYFEKSNTQSPNPHIQALVAQLADAAGGTWNETIDEVRQRQNEQTWTDQNADWTTTNQDDWFQGHQDHDWLQDEARGQMSIPYRPYLFSSIHEAATPAQVIQNVERNLLPEGGKFDQRFPGARRAILIAIQGQWGTRGHDAPDPTLWAVEQIVNLAKKQAEVTWASYTDEDETFKARHLMQDVARAIRGAVAATDIIQRYNLPKKIDAVDLDVFTQRVQGIREEYAERERIRQIKERFRSGEAEWNAEPLPIQLPEGYKVWPIQTMHDLQLESDIMGHCIGDSNHKHFPRIRAGLTNAFSLRDKDGVPHGTAELMPNGDQILAVHGFQNQPLNAKYESLFDDFFAQWKSPEHEWFEKSRGTRGGVRATGPYAEYDEDEDEEEEEREPYENYREDYWDNEGLYPPAVESVDDFQALIDWYNSLTGLYSLENYFEPENGDREYDDDGHPYYDVIPAGESPYLESLQGLFQEEDRLLRQSPQAASPSQQSLPGLDTHELTSPTDQYGGYDETNDNVDGEIETFVEGMAILDAVYYAELRYGGTRREPHEFVDKAIEYFQQSYRQSPNPHLLTLIGHLERYDFTTPTYVEWTRQDMDQQRWMNDWDWTPADDWVGEDQTVLSSFQVEAATPKQVIEHVDKNLLPEGGKFDKQYPGARDAIRNALVLVCGSGGAPDPSLWGVEQIVNLAKKDTPYILESCKNYPDGGVGPRVINERVVSALSVAVRITPLLQRYNLPKKVDATDLVDFVIRMDAIGREYQERERIREFKEELRSGAKSWDAQPLPIELSGGYKVWPVKTEHDLELEGDIMSHCIGDPDHKHFPRIYNGLTNAFSLRDKDGVPHGTVELTGDNERVLSAEGWNDHALSPKYEGLFDQFFEKSFGKNHNWFNSDPGYRSGEWHEGPDVEDEEDEDEDPEPYENYREDFWEEEGMTPPPVDSPEDFSWLIDWYEKLRKWYGLTWYFHPDSEIEYDGDGHPYYDTIPSGEMPSFSLLRLCKQEDVLLRAIESPSSPSQEPLFDEAPGGGDDADEMIDQFVKSVALLDALFNANYFRNRDDLIDRALGYFQESYTQSPNPHILALIRYMENYDLATGSDYSDVDWLRRDDEAWNHDWDWSPQDDWVGEQNSIPSDRGMPGGAPGRQMQMLFSKSEEWEKESIPSHRFVYYRGVLNVEPYAPSVRFRNMIDQILELAEKDMTDHDVEDRDIASGDIFTDKGDLRVELLSLADTEVQAEAIQHVQDWAKDLSLVGPVQPHGDWQNTEDDEWQ